MVEFIRFQSNKGIVMAFKDYSRAGIWRNAIKRYGLPQDPESEISAIENGGVVYVGWDGKVFAIDPENGDRRWSSTLRRHGLKAEESQQIDMAFHGGSLFATWNNRIFRLDPSNGHVLKIRRADAQLAVLLDE
jgi:outer membrane protein assembly factor BamB